MRILLARFVGEPLPVGAGLPGEEPVEVQALLETERASSDDIHFVEVAAEPAEGNPVHVRGVVPTALVLLALRGPARGVAVHAPKVLRDVDAVELAEEAHLRDEGHVRRDVLLDSARPAHAVRAHQPEVVVDLLDPLDHVLEARDRIVREQVEVVGPELLRGPVLLDEPGLRVARAMVGSPRGPSRGPRGARARRSRPPAPSGSTWSGRARSSCCSCPPCRCWWVPVVLDARVFAARVLAADLAVAVGRRVVADQDPEVGEGLRQERVDRLTTKRSAL